MLHKKLKGGKENKKSRDLFLSNKCALQLNFQLLADGNLVIDTSQINLCIWIIRRKLINQNPCIAQILFTVLDCRFQLNHIVQELLVVYLQYIKITRPTSQTSDFQRKDFFELEIKRFSAPASVENVVEDDFYILSQFCFYFTIFKPTVENFQNILPSKS